MTGQDRRGVALVLVLAVVVLVESFSALGIEMALVRIRLAADERMAIESQLVAASALAEARIAHAGELQALADSTVISFARAARADGWETAASAARAGNLIRLAATARRQDVMGNVIANRRVTLLLVRASADTVRVFSRHPRF